MRIRKLTAFIVRLPLKRPFKHASAAREDSHNVLVRCELNDGTSGWGEGVPRSYVTGETPEGCITALLESPLDEQLGADCHDWRAVIELCERFHPVTRGDDPRAFPGSKESRGRPRPNMRT